MKKLKKISLVLLIVFYISAGGNHFIHAETYYSIIPAYLPYPSFINIASGIIEILLGIALVFLPTREIGAYGIVVLLVLFIPAHIYMIQKGGCMGEAICIPAWAARVRLFPLQFLLMAWAWWHRQ